MRPLQDLLDEHPLQPPSGTKDERGHVLLAGGPAGCPGGILLAAEAALRTGVGRLQLAVHPHIAPLVAVAVPETFVLGWDPQEAPGEDVRRCAASADVTVVGPGYRDELTAAAEALTSGSGERPVVLDAGALAATEALEGRRNLVLAPNTSEAAERLGEDGSEAELAAALAKRLGRPLAVRGATTVVADAEGGTWCFDGGSGALGTPGSGDVLVGTLAGLLARGLPPVAALAWSVALHGRTGEILERTMPVGYLARDLAAALPRAFVELGAV